MDENSCDKRSFHGVCCCLRQCLQHTLDKICWNKTLCVRSSREISRTATSPSSKQKRNKQTKRPKSRLWQSLFSSKSAGKNAEQVSASAWQWAWQVRWASEDERKLRLFCSCTGLDWKVVNRTHQRRWKTDYLSSTGFIQRFGATLTSHNNDTSAVFWIWLSGSESIEAISGNVSVKSKLQHPPRAYPGHLTSFPAREEGIWLT